MICAVCSETISRYQKFANVYMDISYEIRIVLKKKLSFLIYITDVKNHFLTNAYAVQISLHLKQMIGN